MVKIVASRAAALKLSQIIFALLIPIGLLGYFAFREMQNDIDFSERELKGLTLLELAAPIVINAEAGLAGAAEEQRIRVAGAAAARNLGISDQFDIFASSVGNSALNANAVSIHSRLRNAQRFAEVVAKDSNLLLDPEAEPLFLILASALSMPDLAIEIQALNQAFAKNSSSQGLQLAEILRLEAAIGRAKKSRDSVVSAVQSARQSSSNPKEYEELLASIFSISNRLSAIDERFETYALGHMTDIDVGVGKIRGDSTQILTDLMKAWQTSNKIIGDRILARIEAMKARMTWIILFSFASAIVGLGMAIVMFKSTLKQLDEVENARFVSEAARQDAEFINAQIASLNRDLSDKVLRLKEAQDELVKKGRMEQLGQLTATVAHEIRNPLGAVRTSAFLLEKKLSGKGLGVESQIGRINKGVVRCDNIITQLLDFSRDKQLICQPAALDDWLVRIVEEEAANLPGIVAVECHLGLADRKVPFDPARLQRVIVNLLANASEAMVGNGEDAGQFKVANPKITISTRLAGEFAVVTVADNGPGIPPDILAKIREPLFTTKSFGTGLGVPAVEKILEQHGGTLQIESEQGKGAAFKAFLPLTAPKDAEVEAA